MNSLLDRRELNQVELPQYGVAILADQTKP